MLSVVHLRPVEGMGPAHLQFPKATHEILLAALDPDQEGLSMLRPLNFCDQMQVDCDEAAVEVASRLVTMVVAGLLWAEPPMSCQVEPWASTLRALSGEFRG